MISLNNTRQVNYWIHIYNKWRTYQRTAKIEGKIKMSFDLYCKNLGVDLTGKTLINIPDYIK